MDNCGNINSNSSGNNSDDIDGMVMMVVASGSYLLVAPQLTAGF
jgi:hypothetical protein